MAPSCSLDETGLHRQLRRYRHAGRGARLVERDARRLLVELDGRVDRQLVEELIAIERACCPFYELHWTPASRRLSVAVAEQRYEPALRAIAFALGFDQPGA